MTTTVKVDAHAGWPVEVTEVDVGTGAEHKNLPKVVEPHTEGTFYVHSTRYLIVRELPQR
jgi:hypothetical protein